MHYIIEVELGEGKRVQLTYLNVVIKTFKLIIVSNTSSLPTFMGWRVCSK